MNTPIDITGITLTTERLLLRPWRESDLADFHEYARVDGVGQMAGWAPHRDLEESRQILSRFIAGKRTFALEHNGKVIGTQYRLPLFRQRRNVPRSLALLLAAGTFCRRQY